MPIDLNRIIVLEIIQQKTRREISVYWHTLISSSIYGIELDEVTKKISHINLIGWLTATPMLGMVLGSYFWGCLADTKGRKYVLITSLLLDGICGILSSISQICLKKSTIFCLLKIFQILTTV